MQNIDKLYVIAMEDEAKDIINQYSLIHLKPFPLYQNGNTLLAITKIGKVNAAFVLSYLLAKYNIDKIINIGFAGANGNYNIGDILIINDARYHDFDLTIFGYELGQVPNLPTNYTSDLKLMEKFNYKKSILYTGDFFMSKANTNSYLVDMEATALFQVAYILNKKIIVFKVVSDIIGREKHLDEYKHFEKNGSSIINEIFIQVQEKL